MNTQEKIHAAALKLFTTEGIANVTMRKVAAAVGVSAPALYRHYPSKDHLVFAIIKHGFDLFYQHELTSMQGKTAWERMRKLCDAYYDFATGYPAHYKLMFLTEWGDFEDPTLHEQMGSHGWVTFLFLVDRVRELQTEKLIHATEPAEAVAMTIWSSLHGVVSLALCGVMEYKEVPVRWQYDYTVRKLWEGLGTQKLVIENELVTPKSYG